MKRNNLNLDCAKSLVYVHYNLRLLSHYCEHAKNNRTYVTLDNNLDEDKLEDGAIALKRLEAELLGDWDGDHVVEMPPSSTSRFIDATILPLALQPPSLHGGCVALGHASRPIPSTEETPILTPIAHRSQEKELKISNVKRKYW